jgi:uncharacterized sulfatase
MKFLKNTLIAGAMVSLQFPVSSQTKPKMNVVVVVIDDIGPAWLPPYAKSLKASDMEQAAVDAYSKQQKKSVDILQHLSAAKSSMPFVDSMSSQSIVFNNAFATSSICAPSRAGMLTSRYQENWGAYNLEDMADTGIPLNEVVLPSLFKKNGYTSAVIGKWHVGLKDKSIATNPNISERHKRSSCQPEYNPLNRGFDYYYGFNSSESKYYKSDDLWENFEPVPIKPESEFLTETLNQKADSFITKALERKQPFFIYYAPMSIHGSLTTPPEKYMSGFNTGIQFSDRIAGHLLALDEGIKNIYATLKKYNQEKNTLIVICSDNGPSNPVMPYSAPLKGGKGSGLLGGSRVPLLMILPGVTKETVVDNNVSTLDIMPTALDLAGIAIPKNLDGVSLKRILVNRDLSFVPHEYLFSSGSHSVSWSINYLDGKTPADPSADKDRKICPNFLWGMSGKNVFLNISPIAKGAYSFLPEGLPEQKFFYKINSDTKQNVNLYNGKDADQKLLESKTIDWLKAKKEPAVYNKEAYKVLSEK